MVATGFPSRRFESPGLCGRTDAVALRDNGCVHWPQIGRSKLDATANSKPTVPHGNLVRTAGTHRTRAKKQAHRLIGGTLVDLSGRLFELHVNAATSRVDGNALLRGGNADYHAGLI